MIFLNRNVLFGLLVAIGFAVYANSLQGEFQYDDSIHITGNSHLQQLSLRELKGYFADSSTSSNQPSGLEYRPLILVSEAICWWIAGGKTWPFHLYKVLLHILSAWLMFLISLNLIKRSPKIPNDVASPEAVAFIASLFFLVHPAQTEAVNYITATNSLQCAFFYLLAFWLMVKESTILMSLALACALLTKQEAATFPAAVILFWFTCREKRLHQLCASLAVLAIYLVIYIPRQLPKPHVLGTEPAIYHNYFITQIWAWVYYIFGIFKPWGYSVAHRDFQFCESVLEPRVLAGIAVVLLALFLTYRWSRPKIGKKSFPILAIGVGWYYLTILPASSVFVLTNVVQEYRCYLPYTILFSALAYGAAYWLGKLEFKAGVGLKLSLSTLLVLLCGLTIARNEKWATPLSLWSDVLAKDPQNAKAYLERGNEYLKANRLEESLQDYDICVRLSEMHLCYLNKYIVYRGLKDNESARQAIEKAVSLGTDDPRVPFHYSKYLFEIKKNPKEALVYAKKCEELSRGTVADCFSLQTIFQLALGHFNEAIEAGKRSLELYPNDKQVQEWVHLAQTKTPVEF